MSFLITFLFDEIQKRYLQEKFNEYINEFLKEFFKLGSSSAIISVFIKPESEDQDKDLKKIFEKMMTLPLNVKSINIEDNKIIIEVESEENEKDQTDNR
jgi:riboflavin synthase